MADRTTYPLADKVVLITGAGRGLGASTAEVLARRGARIALADIDLPAAERTAAGVSGGRSVALACDVTSADDVGRVIEVNVAGAVNTASAAIESVIANRGQIVLSARSSRS